MAVKTHVMKGEKVLVTGGQGPSGLPPARVLAKDNEVHVMARFTDPNVRVKLESMGIHCLKHDLLSSFDDIPDDFTYVWHSALPTRTPPTYWPNTFDHGADAAARLAYRCRNAKGFGLVSTASVYEPDGHNPVKEDRQIGHHVPGTYGAFSKFAMEQAVTFVSRQFGLPVTILRMGSPSGLDGGTIVERLIRIVAGEEIPLHPEKPNLFRPHFEIDLARMAVNAMVEARTPPVIVNFCGDQIVSAEEYCAYLGELVGKQPKIVYTSEGTYTSLVPDTAYMHEILGECEVDWKAACRELVQAKVWEKGYARDY